MRLRTAGRHCAKGRRGPALARAVALAGLAAVSVPLNAAATPARVVSINLCTDQLALMLARPGQLVSVSRLAGDPALSNLPEEAKSLPANDGRAEEIVALSPDIVLAGSFSSRATVGLLARLGVRVEEFTPASSFAGIRADIMRMGDLLGQRARAEELVRVFDARLADLGADADPADRRPVAVVYHTGNGTDGRGSLSDEILAAAGWRNLADDLGLGMYGVLPLEVLVERRPDLVLVGEAEADWSTPVQPNVRHPAILAVTGGGDRLMVLPDRVTLCGTPFVADAVARLVGERHRLAASGEGAR